MNKLRLPCFLRPVDALTIGFAITLSGVLGFNAQKIEGSTFLVVANLSSSLAIYLMGRAAAIHKNRLSRFVHDWYPVPAIFLVFKEMHVVIQSMSPGDWDQALINIDRAIFGYDPTIWLGKHSSPVLTELLQLSYVSYYFIMLAVGIELFVKEDRARFSYVLFVITYGFFLSYLGYYLFPAVGPRFTLHDFARLDVDLPGIWLTHGIRDLINSGESIPRDTADAVAHAQRDAFPSGHTQMTLLSLFLAFRYHLKSRWILTILGILLIVSTVYLRYHYVIDVLAGGAFMLFTVWTAPKLFGWWENLKA